MMNLILAAHGGDLPMEEAPSPLLPPWYDVFWSLVCFIVLLLIFAMFVVPKFLQVLAEREERIEGGIQRAEAAQIEAKAALEKYNAQLSDARAEAAEIREQARERGKQIETEMREQATQESNRIIESGEKQLHASRQQVVEELRQEMGLNSISLAERLVGRELSDSTKRSGTIDSFLSELDSVSASTGK